MKKLLLLTKTLLAVALLCVGQSAWGDAVASHDFNSSTTPFIIHDGARIGVTYEEHVADGGDYYAKYSCTRSSGKAFAYYNFSSSVADAASVAVEFDCYFKSGSWQSFISLADANYHTADVLGIGNVNYNKTGAIFNLGQNRAKVSGTNEDHFGINSAHVSALDETCLEKWIHVSITVDNASRKVSYTIKNADQTSTLKSETNINFLDATAQRCSQVDIYLGNNTSNFVYIDNLVITKTVSDVSHNYTINAVSGGSTIKANMASGEAKEGATYTVSGLPYVIENGGNFYVLDDANVTNNGVTFTMLKVDQTKTVNYTLDESIVYFKEAESFGGSAASSPESRASGGAYTSYFQSKKTNDVTTLNKGVYRVETYIWSRTDKEINLYKTSKDDANILASLTGSGSRSKDFLIDTNSTAIKLSSVNNSCCFDYILIRKLYDVEGEVVGKVDYTTNYSNAWNTTPIWINAGETAYYKFINYNNTASANLYENWYLFGATEASENVVIFGPNHSNTATHGTYTSKPTFTMADLNGATVELTTTLTDAGDGTYTLTTTGVTTKADGTTKLSPNLVYQQTGLTASKLKLYVSVEKSWLALQEEAVKKNIVIGYATYYSNNALDFAHATPSLTASIVTGATNGVLNETNVNDVPAETGVLLTGENGTYTIPVIASSSTSVTGNKLEGVHTATLKDANSIYILMNENDVPGFYKNNKNFTVGANTAYLSANFAEVAVGARSAYFFRGDITGVDNVEAASEAKAKEGKFIENGKLVIVKNGVKYNAAGAKLY